MSSFQSVELYDPESPSVDDDLCLELGKSTTSACKVSESAVSCVQSRESSVDFSDETENAENVGYNQKLSSTEGCTDLKFIQCTATDDDRQERVLDVVQTEEPDKPVVVSKPTVIWKSTKKILRRTLKEFDDVQTVEDDTGKASLNATFPDTSMHSPDVDHQKLQRAQLLQQQYSNLNCVADDSVNSAVCGIRGITNTSRVSAVSEPVTTEEIHVCDRNNRHSDTLQRTPVSEPSSMMHNSYTSSIVEIAEPTEPCAVNDQTLALSQEPRTIELSRIVEDPSEPDELLQMSDTNCNNEQVKCPRLIRLDRATDFESHPVAQMCDGYISDPSEPTDIEPTDGENHEAIPREIKLNRVSDSQNLFDVFAPNKKQNSSSLIKPRIVQLNTLIAKTDKPVTERNSIVKLSDIKAANEIAYCDTPLSPTESIKPVSDEIVHFDETPLSPTESVKSVSDSDLVERQATKPFMPEVNLFENCDFLGVTDVENKWLLSWGSSAKSNHSVSTHPYLSDGEIVDEEEKEPCGIFQISASTPFSENNTQNFEQDEKKSGKKRPYESVVDDVGRNKPEDGPGASKRSKHLHSKTISKLPSSEKQKRKKHKSEQASRSSEKLLVGDSQATKRKVVVLNETVNEPKKNRCSEHCVSPSVVVTRKIPPSFSEGNLHAEALECKKRTSVKRKHTAKWHRKRHLRRNESHTHKRRRKHKKHRHRKHRSDAEGSVDILIQRHSRSRTRSYDRIVEMIRSEERQQSPRVHRLRSVVVHENTLVSARQRSSSDSSYDSHHSFGNLALTDVCQNSDSRSRNVSDGPMHLSRLSYSGLLEHDGHTTLLGECIRSKCGPDFDMNLVSRNLANVLFGTDDDVEILGVSYPGEMQSKNNNLQNADISSQRRSDGREEVALSLVDNQSRVTHVERLSSDAGEKSLNVNRPANNDVTDRVEIKKVTLSKEVQTQESLFAETRDRVTECTVFSQSKQFSDHGKADKELQVSDFDNDVECTRSLSSSLAGGCNMVLSEAASSIQSPESHVEEGSHVPRPVLLERTDAKPTPDSPKQDFNDICFTVPNISESPLSITKTIELERVAESVGDLLPHAALSDTSVAVNNATERQQLGAVTVSCTEISNTPSTGLVLGKSSSNTAGQLSPKNNDADVVKRLPVDSNAHRKEQYQLLNSTVPVTAPAVHHLPPLVLHKPFQYQRAVPLHRVNSPFTENQSVHHTDSVGSLQQLSITKQPIISVNGHSSAAHLSDTSAIQQLPSEPAVAMSHSAQSQQPLIARTLSVGVSDVRSVPAIPSSSGFPQVQCAIQTTMCSSGLAEPLSFFTLKSDRIPGICEDVEPDASRYESRIGVPLSSHQNSLIPSSLLQMSGSLGVVNVVVTTAATTISEMQQPTITPSCGVMSYMDSASYVTTDSLPLSSSQAGIAAVRCSVPQSTVMPTAAVNSGNSVMKQSVAPLLPLLGTIATQLFKIPLQPQSTTVPVSSTMASVIPAVSSRSSVVTVPALKHATTTVTSTEAISAWITSLPKSTTVEKPQISSQPSAELDFDVDAVVSPLSDEIMSFSPPSSEHMMAVVKMKHTLGLHKKSAKNTTNGLQKPTKTELVSHKILMKMRHIFVL